MSSGTTRLLSEAQERELLERWIERGDQAALDRLVTAHKPLVLKIASKYRSHGPSLPDLVQEGFVGLMEAAHRFDLDRDVRFATYAQWWIKSSIQDFVLRNNGAVRAVTSSRQKSLLYTLRRMQASPNADAMPDEATRQKLATQFSVSPEAVDRMALRVNARDMSLDMEIGRSGDTTLGDLIADDRPGPEELVSDADERAHRHDWLLEALAELPDRERRIIVERHLDEDKPILRDLGESFGVSKERVRQLEKRALDRLRASLERRREYAEA